VRKKAGAATSYDKKNNTLQQQEDAENYKHIDRKY